MSDPSPSNGSVLYGLLMANWGPHAPRFDTLSDYEKRRLDKAAEEFLKRCAPTEISKCCNSQIVHEGGEMRCMNCCTPISQNDKIQPTCATGGSTEETDHEKE